MTKASDNVFPRFLISEGGSTATPAAGRVTIYAKADGLLYQKDDAGTETQLANGASGSVATDAIWDAAGDLVQGTGANTAARLALGTAGQVLKVNAGATAVEWGAASGGGGALVLLQTQTASSSATLDFTSTISGTYDDYRIEFINVLPATNNVRLWMRMSTDGGSSYDAGAAVYTYTQFRYASTAGSAMSGGTASAIFISTTDNVSSNTTWNGLNGTVSMFNPGGSGYKMVTYKTTVSDGIAAGFQAADGAAVYTSTTAVNAIRFLFSSGNIASGIIRTYGIAKT